MIPNFVAAAEVAGVHDDADGLAIVALRFQIGFEAVAEIHYGGFFFVVAEDRNDDNVGRSETRGQDETVVVGVGHDEAADEARADAPGSGPAEFFAAFTGEEFDFLRFGKVLAEEVGRAGLERLAVLHHRFDRIGIDGAGESFAGSFFASDDGHGHEVLREGGVDVEHFERFVDGFLLRGVGGVAFLPEELGGAQEQARAHFPADDVSPLVNEDGQVAVGLDPFGVHRADDGFAGGADDEGFFERADRDEAAFGTDF